MHLKGARGEPTILSTGTIKRLHEPPPNGNYAAGWGVATRSWAGGTVLSHSGSNTMFYVTAWIAPEKNLVMVAATNRGGDPASVGVDAAFKPLIDAYAK